MSCKANVKLYICKKVKKCQIIHTFVRAVYKLSLNSSTSPSKRSQEKLKNMSMVNAAQSNLPEKCSQETTKPRTNAALKDTALLCIHDLALVWRWSFTDTKASRVCCFCQFKQITMMQQECFQWMWNVLLNHQWSPTMVRHASQQPGQAQY